MKIVFHFEGELPVKTYGGIERIVFWHMCELVRLGHEVVLIGHPESKVSEFGINLIPINMNDRSNWTNLIPKNADIIHLSYNATIPGNIPTISTVHGNGKIGEIFHENSVFVSKKHAEIHGATSFIHNAIDFNEYPFIPKKLNWDRFLFLAKASWRVKNLSHAVKVCRNNNKHLEVIGGRWIGLSRYIHNHGIIGGEKKLEIMRNCDALIFPVRWHEPFGIAVIEAMSQGLPVIGSPYGSLPELINKDVGFIAHSLSHLNEIISNPSKQFDSEKIRHYAEDNFNLTKHANSYLELYKNVIAGKKLNSKNPTYQFSSRAENLLEF
jgi:glycosyltransferase involved in cell wall biosynthesis